MRSFNTYESIFEDLAMTWINPDLLRGHVLSFYWASGQVSKVATRPLGLLTIGRAPASEDEA
jgi:hypothetical protein